MKILETELKRPNTETTPVLLLPPAGTHRIILERMVIRQQQHEARFGTTGNDVLRDARESGKGKIISKDSFPQGLENNRTILESYYSQYNQGVWSIFVNSITDSDDQRKLSHRYQHLGQNLANTFPLVYGTSGTETNSKEIGNTLGSVKWLTDHGVDSVGVYFVEDAGHPFNGTILAEQDSLVPYVSAQKKISPEAAYKLIKHTLNTLYGTKVYDLYDPDSQAVQQVIKDIADSKEQAEVKNFFAAQHEALIQAKKLSDLSTVAANIPLPESAKIQDAYSLLGFPEQTTNLLTGVADYILQRPEEFPNPSISDFRTVLQGVIGLQLAYKAYGAEEMPLWIVDTWYDICERSNAKDITITQTKDQVKLAYEGLNRRILNFVCPGCNDEHGVYSENQQKYSCGADRVISLIAHQQLSFWRWGGNSGIFYYEIFNKLAESGDFAIFVDNYEANGPQERLMSADKTPWIYPPNNRVWTINANPYYKNDGSIDANATLGNAVPSELLYTLIQANSHPQSEEVLKKWFEYSGECGLDNNCGVLYADLNSTGLKVLPYHLLRGWKYTPEFTNDSIPVKEIDTAYVVSLYNQLERGEGFSWLANHFPDSFAVRRYLELTSEIDSRMQEIGLLEHIKFHGTETQAKIADELKPLSELFDRLVTLKRKARLVVAAPFVNRLKGRTFKNADQVLSAIDHFDVEEIAKDLNTTQAIANEVIRVLQEDMLAQFEASCQGILDKTANLRINRAVLYAQEVLGLELGINKLEDPSRVLLGYFPNLADLYTDVKFLKAEYSQLDDKQLQQVLKFLAGKVKEQVLKKVNLAFTQASNDFANQDPEYIEVYREYTLLKEQLNTEKLRSDQHLIGQTNQERARRIERLAQRINFLTKERDDIVWQILNSFASKTGYHIEYGV